MRQESSRADSHTAPGVSVIIPAYRVTDYIAETLDSALTQTYRDFEIIVVNDGCPDSAALEHALQPYHGRIRYLKKQNGGVSSARNLGLRAARAPLIALLDGDDVLLPDYLAVQTEFLRRHPEVDVVYCNGIVFGDSPLAGRKVMDLSPSEGEVTFENLVSCRCSVMTALTARKDALLKVGGFDEDLHRAEDFELWVRAVHAGVKFAYHETSLFRYRRRDNGLSANGALMREGGLAALDKLENTLELSPTQRTAVQQARKMFKTHIAYYRMTEALRGRDAAAAEDAVRQMLQLNWHAKYALLDLGLRFAPHLTLRLAERRVR
jgi:glycosyltransferase involved in cell wall biosynthesis